MNKVLGMTLVAALTVASGVQAQNFGVSNAPATLPMITSSNAAISYAAGQVVRVEVDLIDSGIGGIGMTNLSCRNFVDGLRQVLQTTFPSVTATVVQVQVRFTDSAGHDFIFAHADDVAPSSLGHSIPDYQFELVQILLPLPGGISWAQVYTKEGDVETTLELLDVDGYGRVMIPFSYIGLANGYVEVTFFDGIKTYPLFGNGKHPNGKGKSLFLPKWYLHQLQKNRSK